MIERPVGARGAVYPWLIALIGMLVLFVSNGFTATALSVFDEALLGEFGWERGPFKRRDFLNFAITAALAPFVGIVIDRLNPKWLMIAGLGLLSCGYFAYSRLSAGDTHAVIALLAVLALAGLAGMALVIRRSGASAMVQLLGFAVVLATMAGVVHFAFIAPGPLASIYLIHVGFGLALSTTGTMLVVVLVSSWFLERRGLAIGIAVFGTSLGGIVLSPVNAWLIAELGWRSAFTWLALLPIGVALVVLLAVRGTPEQAGAVALGQRSGDPGLRQYGFTLAEAIRTPTFWAISVSGFLTYYAILALFNHLFLHMRGLGFEPQAAARSLALLGAMAALSKIVIGWLADVVDRRRVFLTCLAVMLGGTLVIALGDRSTVWAGIAVTGGAWGGLFTLYNMLAANNFGLKELGRINGAINLLEAMGSGLGIWLTGELFDVFGSYRMPFLVIAGCVFAGLVTGFFIRGGSPEAMGLKQATASG